MRFATTAEMRFVRISHPEKIPDTKTETTRSYQILLNWGGLCHDRKDLLGNRHTARNGAAISYVDEKDITLPYLVLNTMHHHWCCSEKLGTRGIIYERAGLRIR